ncbi:hypothetical protein BJ741DRAFT_600479 [Chytriomyces cf. hyalinus JEL632]|nr:hypothetical protein BJ741DRAFT_600479 [Chytriomyces cf. hyalinus JEL632]
MSTRVLLFQLLFLATGMLSTLGAQWVKYRGAANALSFVTSLCQFIGMILVAALPPTKTYTDHQPDASCLHPNLSCLAPFMSYLRVYGPANIRGAAFISVLEVAGNLILVAGMFLTGSGLFMVIYSSIVVFTALFSRMLLPGRSLSRMQWASVISICFGLSLTAIGNTGNENAAASHLIFLGILVCIFGTAVLSLVYVATDHILTEGSSTPYSQCIWVGIFSSLLTLVAMLVLSIPSLRTLPLFDSDVVMAHLILILSSLGHSVAYFELVESTGGIATGVLQGLRAVGVFGLSHVWFCERDEGQCFTVWKGAATVIVVCGVVTFAAAKGMQEKGAGKGEYGGSLGAIPLPTDDFYDEDDDIPLGRF